MESVLKCRLNAVLKSKNRSPGFSFRFHLSIHFSLCPDLTTDFTSFIYQKCKLVRHKKRKFSDEKGNYLTV